MLDRLVALLGRHRTPIMQLVARSNPALPKRIWIGIPSVRRSESEKGWRIPMRRNAISAKRSRQLPSGGNSQLDSGAVRNGWVDGCQGTHIGCNCEHRYGQM